MAARSRDPGPHPGVGTMRIRMLVTFLMSRSGRLFHLALVAAMLAGWCMGCQAPRIKPVLTDPDPSVKVPAIELAVKQHDLSAIPILINNLESDDPAIRFYANDALQKLTGRNFGFPYYADEEVRRPAVQRWREWYAGSASQPATVSTQP
jgi:hypothetical protein